MISGPIDHPLRYAQAIALAGRAIELWPRDYKSWWMLGEATTLYSQAIWNLWPESCVPETAKMRLANQAFDDIVRKRTDRVSLRQSRYSPVNCFPIKRLGATGGGPSCWNGTSDRTATTSTRTR